MRLITSAQNPRYKEMKQLATTSKARRQAGLTILEGIHLSDSYLHHDGVPVGCAVSDSALANPEVEQLLKRLDRLEVDCLVVADSQFKALSNLDHGIGILLVIKQPATTNVPVLEGNAVLLDDIQDPGNVGTMLRTAAAAGVTTVYCSPATASVWSPKVLRAGMGAQFTLTVYEGVNLAEIIAAATVPVLATTLEATQTIYQADLTRPLAWLFGNEGQGVSPALLALPVEQVIIPQAANVESLNVSAAAAVCLFEQRRQSL